MTIEYGKLTFLEIREKAEAGYMAIVPTGCTEQQGPHTTVDLDTWLATELTIEAATVAYEKYEVKSLVLPTIPFGPTPEHRNYKYGFIDIPQNVYEDLIYSVLSSLADQGFKQILIFRGCGGHYLNSVTDKFNKDYEGSASVTIPQHPYYEVWCKHADPEIPAGHSDSFTTSLAMYKHPERVREDKIFNPHSSEPDWEDPNLDFSKYSETGVIGDPTYANTELGKKLWNDTVDAVAVSLKEVISIGV
ncbi:creatininase family protein [Metabacillus litoralis]|uniref:creatininase family protein n=1 Tax=Metabacillus litoralis TaxID=152268 RepID=UPI001CFE4252|nr:creatininase family protein [Metabacillus litoralis]